MSGVCVVGSANLDVVVPVDGIPAPGETVLATGPARRHAGGKGLNQAVAAARAGSRVALVASVGDDEAGARLRSVLATEGVDADAVTTRPGTASGTAHVTVQADGENAIVVVPGANAAVSTLERAGRAAVEAAGVLLAQLEVPPGLVAEAAARARGSGGRVVLNAAPASPGAHDLLALVDVLLVNRVEACALTGEDDPARAARALATQGVAVVVTLGALGALLLAPGEDLVTVPSPQVHAVDTTGAGDAAAGTLATALAAGSPLPAAVRRACAAGALAVQVRGAVPSLPTREAVDALLAHEAAEPGGPDADVSAG